MVEDGFIERIRQEKIWGINKVGIDKFELISEGHGLNIYIYTEMI